MHACRNNLLLNGGVYRLDHRVYTLVLFTGSTFSVSRDTVLLVGF